MHAQCMCIYIYKYAHVEVCVMISFMYPPFRYTHLHSQICDPNSGHPLPGGFLKNRWPTAMAGSNGPWRRGRQGRTDAAVAIVAMAAGFCGRRCTGRGARGHSAPNSAEGGHYESCTHAWCLGGAWGEDVLHRDLGWICCGGWGVLWLLFFFRLVLLRQGRRRLHVID